MSFAPDEIDAAQIGAAELGRAQIAAGEIAALQRGAFQIDAVEQRARRDQRGQRALRQIGHAAQVHAREIGGLAFAAVGLGPARMCFQQFLDAVGARLGIGPGPLRSGSW